MQQAHVNHAPLHFPSLLPAANFAQGQPKLAVNGDIMTINNGAMVVINNCEQIATQRRSKSGFHWICHQQQRLKILSFIEK